MEMLFNESAPGLEKELLQLKKRLDEIQQVAPLGSTVSTFADMLPVAIVELNLETRFVFVNEFGLKFFGYTKEDFEKGVYLKDVFKPEELKRSMANLQKVARGERSGQHEYEVIIKDGSVINVLINSDPIFKNGELAGFRSCCADITDRKQAEVRLQESEKKFRSVFDRSPIGIAFMDQKGRLLEGNGSFLRMWKSLAGFSGQPETASMLKVFNLSGRMRDRIFGGHSVDGTSEVLKKGVENIPGPGFLQNTRFYEWQMTPLSEDPGKKTRIMIQLTDVSTRKREELLEIQHAKESVQEAEKCIEELRLQLKERSGFGNIIGTSRKMAEIYSVIPQMAEASATVLITGESGTGKELIARALHESGCRKNGPFVAINCSALPDSLLEAELFGYKAGAFTDAKKDKPGKFELADGGTLFLDEVADTSPVMQAKLLRVLQERSFVPLGGVKPRRVDVRIVAATNKDITELISRGEFRDDLYFRIKVLKIELPPLRERRGDIPLLAQHFLEQFNQHYSRNITGFTREARQLLYAYDYPGNIRELQNIIEQAHVLCRESEIQAKYFPAEISIMFNERNVVVETTDIEKVDELEFQHIRNMIVQCKGNKTLAAQKLGIHKTTLFRKLRKWEEERV